MSRAVLATPAATGAPRPAARRRAPRWLSPLLASVATLSLLWLVFVTHASGQTFVAMGLLVLGGSAIAVYASARSMAWKYLYPGVAGMLVFVAFPLLYTVQIAFTNYSSNHLLGQERTRSYLLAQHRFDEAHRYAATLHAAPGAGVQLQLVAPDGALLTTPVLRGDTVPDAALALADGAAPGAPLSLRETVAQRGRLRGLQLLHPDGTQLSYAGLREFGLRQPLWAAAADGALTRVADGQRFEPDLQTGYFRSTAGETVQPGFKVGVGTANYRRMLFDADFRGPFVAIFIWTVAFAALTVLFSTALGLFLAVLLDWPALRGRGLYRTLLFLPYAVPGFISILVFKGLFNQNFGEVNAILDALFGLRPAWFADPALARTMLLIVNTWLGYPYIMILCTGLLKSIPADLYEASAIAGATPWLNFRRITAPLVLRPLTPLLISAFAFNFNNFVLIALLTDGRPDYLNTKLPAGTTDILVSYTYRIEIGRASCRERV